MNKTFNAKILIDSLSESAVDAQKDIANKALKGIIDRSPVKSGHYKKNHQVTIDAENNNEIPGTDPSGSATLLRGRQEIEKIKELGHKITIQNNVPYAKDIEFGTSQQAPGGVYRLAKLDVIK